MKEDIRQLSLNELKNWLKNNNEPAFRAKQIFHWIWKNALSDFDLMHNLPDKLKQNLKDNFTINDIKDISQLKSKDNTVKAAFALHDGKVVEGVLIPSKDRVTACISTQVGCKMGCSFCATGKMGFSRNLLSGEIFLQAFKLNQISSKIYDKNLSNIVVMGMGEPLDNYDNTTSALRMIMDNYGMNMSHRRITLSTVGLAPAIKKLADSGLNINISISLHTADEQKRSTLIPVNKKYSLSDLAKSLLYYYQKTKKRISYEYILFRDINDSKEDAELLSEFTKITPCKINLIEYNAVDGSNYKKANNKQTAIFMKTLENKNLIVKLRRSKGSDIDAACGQLANKYKF